MLFCIYFSQYAKLQDYNEAITIKKSNSWLRKCLL